MSEGRAERIGARARWEGQGALVLQLDDPPAPAEAFRRLARWPACLFLDSAAPHPRCGRYCFLAADPFRRVAARGEARGVLDRLRRELARWPAAAIPDLPPFQGGAAGLLSYDLGRWLEPTPAPAVVDHRCPLMLLGLYDVVLAYDRASGGAWVVSQGFPETEPAARRRRARRRADQLLARLAKPPAQDERPGPAGPPPAGPLKPAGRSGSLWSDFTAEEYLETVRRAVDAIWEGELFQVNLAQRLAAPAAAAPAAMYLALRRRNPSPFAGYFDAGSFQLASASPERLLCLRGDRLETRPIKGTRARCADEQADHEAAEALAASGKDRAENTMIVDLARNDLARVCRPDSIRVTQWCGLESYAHVHHLVSAVEGRLAPGADGLDALGAVFPGGSVTGAPKPRAMRMISELEPVARGPYCGSLGYLGFDGAMDWNILIRTLVIRRGWACVSVGGAVVADSDPEREYDETWRKAKGMLEVL